MTTDGRVDAWLGAFKRIEQAQRLKTDRKRNVLDTLPEVYWAAVAEAQVLAALATASDAIGESVGDYLQRELAEKKQKSDDILILVNSTRG